MSDITILTELIESGRKILADGSKIQDITGLADQFPIEERQHLADQLSQQYHSWYARAQNALPSSDQREFIAQYKSSFFDAGIDKFFAEPLIVNPLYNTELSKSDLAKLVPFWQHPYSSTLKKRMTAQIVILERRRENRPAILKLPDGEVRLPRNLRGHQTEIEAFLEKSPYEQNVFLMMRYRESNNHISNIIRSSIEGSGLKLWLAKDIRITDELATNVVASLLCCKYGVALFDEPEDAQHINPNVSYELGMLHLLDRHCLILKGKNITIQSDLLAKLWIEYDPSKIGEIISFIKSWLLQVGTTTPQ